MRNHTIRPPNESLETADALVSGDFLHIDRVPFWGAALSAGMKLRRIFDRSVPNEKRAEGSGMSA